MMACERANVSGVASPSCLLRGSNVGLAAPPRRMRSFSIACSILRDLYLPAE